MKDEEILEHWNKGASLKHHCLNSDEHYNAQEAYKKGWRDCERKIRTDLNRTIKQMKEFGMGGK